MLCSCHFMITLLALAASAGAVCPPDFLDTRQAQNGAILSVKGSVDGNPVDLKGHGVLVLPYCDQASPVCTLGCRVTFETIHSPNYYINGSCLPAGGNTSVKELERIGVNATHAHPNYVVQFPCRAISEYTCYMNETVYTQVEVRPDASACIVPPPPVATNDPTPPGSDGNSSTGNSTTGNSTTGNSTTGNSTTEVSTNGSTIPTTVPHHSFPFFTAGLIAGGILIFVLTAIAAIVLLIIVLHCDRFRVQGRRVVNGMRRVVRRLRPCCPSGQVDSGNIAMPATYDNGPHELVAVPGVSSPPDGGVQGAFSVVRT